MVRQGEKYRHYKGKVVEVVAITIMHAAGSKGDIIYYDNSPSFAVVTDDFSPGESMVIYKEIGELKEWARPLRIFEEVLGKTTKFYRFEKIV